MEVALKHYGGDKKKTETSSSDISGLLSELSINPETVIIRINNEIVTNDTSFSPGDEIELIPVVSGG